MMINLAGTPAIRPSITIIKALELKSCFDIGFRSLEHLKQAHARLLRLGLCLEDHLLNSVFRYYSQFGNTHYSKLVFDQINESNVFLFNTMIETLVSNDFFEEAIKCYHSMRSKDILPNSFTCPLALKACGRNFDYQLGLKIHGLAVKLGFDKDMCVNTSLVSMYTECGSIYDAHKEFDNLRVKDLASWIAIIKSYLDDGKFYEALSLFKSLLTKGLEPDRLTLVRIFCACAEVGALEFGEWIHEYVNLNGIRKDMILYTSLINMYAKCGRMDKAHGVFDQMVEKDVVAWTSMIQGYVENGFAKKAIDMFLEMEKENVKPDCNAVVGVLRACTRLRAIKMGERAINSIRREEVMAHLPLGTTIIDMYAKCGKFNSAFEVFKEMKDRDIVVWNATISGLSLSGNAKVAFGLFAQMMKWGFQPNGNTFLGLLCGCTYVGLVDEGWKFFNSMERDFSVTPNIAHYGCMVDLLSRWGLLQEAHEFIQSMPMEPDVIVWRVLLGGCRLHRNNHLAEHVLEKLVQLEPWNSKYLALLDKRKKKKEKKRRKMLKKKRRLCDAERISIIMNERDIQKIPRCSWIEVDGMVHKFEVDDKSHPLSDQIHMKLGELLKDLQAAGMQYAPTADFSLFDVDEEL